MAMRVSACLATGGDKEEWDNFVGRNEYGSFLQSWAWGDLQEKLGNTFWRLVFKEEKEVKGVALVIKRKLPLGQDWLYVPGGPILKNPNDQTCLPDRQVQISNILGKIVGLAKEERAVYAKVDPVVPESIKVGLGEGWRKSNKEVQPRDTLVLDLGKSEEDLLADMHQKTRYNIRLAQRKGVKIRFSREGEDIESFIKLAGEVSKRTSFRYHPDDYYRAMGEVLVPADLMEIAVAEYGDEALAVSLLINFGGVTTYVHGASSGSRKEMMAPNLMQWQSILRAKERGSGRYDFYGVAPEGVVGHPWSGVTKFKEGFGGRRVNYLGAYDYVVNRALYTMYDMVVGRIRAR